MYITQYFGGGCWVGNNPKRFFRSTLCLEYLSSGENRAANQENEERSLIAIENGASIATKL